MKFCIRPICGLLVLLGWVTSAPAQSFGPYSVTRVLPLPIGGVGDLEMMDGFLYTVDDYNGFLHKLDPMTGQNLITWTIPGLGLHDDWPFDRPTGLAWDGSRFWMSSSVPNNLRRLRFFPPGSILAEIVSTLPGWTTDLAFANGFLYHSEYLGAIRRVDPMNGMVVGYIPAPSEFIYALTFDGENFLAGSGIDDMLWVISPETGAVIDSWHTGMGTMNGLAYDRSTRSLYMAHSYGISVAQIPEPSWAALAALFAGYLLARHRAKES